MKRGRRMFGAAILIAALDCAPASAHTRVSGIEAVLDSSTAPAPGVSISLQHGIVDLLAVGNQSSSPLTVSGPSGRPFLRIGAGGVDADVSSPDWLASETVSPQGARPFAPTTATTAISSPATAVTWAHVGDDPTWTWADPRLRLTPSGSVATRGTWHIPVTLGSRTVDVRGHIHQRLISGEWDSSIDPAALAAIPGLAIATVDARAPSLVATYTGTPTVIVLGRGGEPLIRFSAAGTEVNTASPTWALTSILSGRPPVPTIGSHVAARWDRVSTGSVPLQWVEPRMAYPDRPPATNSTQPVVLARWQVPFQVDGAPVDLTGTTAWQWYGPFPGVGFLSSSRTQGAGLALAAGAVAGAYVLYRRRAAGVRRS